MAKREVRTLWWVSHPEHSTAVVIAPNWEQATVEAARWWDVPWSKAAALCECEKKDELPRFVCARCGKIHYGREPGQVYCSLCEAIKRQEEERRKARRRRYRA